MSDIISGITSGKTSDSVFDKPQIAPLSLIALEGASEMGDKIKKHLVDWAKKNKAEFDFSMVDSDCPRFSSGDAKGLIKETIRGTDLFIIVDVGNYSCTYKMFGENNKMSPDDHYQNLKRIIQAAGGKARRINVVMPTLFGGRQHRRNYRESLDCAVSLQELERMGVENIITFDAHDPRVCNAVPLMGFDNVMPQYQVLKALFSRYKDLQIDHKTFMVVSPDEGALDRNTYFSSVLGVELGMFYKRRDYSVIVNGRNPIVAHEFLGDNVEGKDILIADDMIASGESMLDIAVELKKRKAGRIFIAATFAMFTQGLAQFDEAYKKGLITRVLATNLTYRNPELKTREWFYEVDMSKYIAFIIAMLHHDHTISRLLRPAEKITALLNKHRQRPGMPRQAEFDTDTQ